MVETFYLVILAAVLFVLLYSLRQFDETVHLESATQLLFNVKNTCAEWARRKL